MRLGSGKDELYVRRRFLQCLQQGIECLLTEHMNLVNDVDLVTALSGRILTFVSQVPHLVDGIVGGAVYFNHVQATTIHDSLSNFRVHGDVERRTILPIQGFRKQAGRGGFPRTSGTDKEIGVGNPAHFDRIA